VSDAVNAGLAAPPSRARFAPTRRIVVLSAAHTDTTHARAALALRCEAYWYPLYACVRGKSYSPPDAEDPTQAFFAQVLEEHLIVTAEY